MRPTHPTRRTPREAVAEIDDDATFFSSFFAANGFYQIPLHPDSQHLTTLMTPWGRYRILRASMGLSCSSDKYNRWADKPLKLLNSASRNPTQVPSLGSIGKRSRQYWKFQCRYYPACSPGDTGSGGSWRPSGTYATPLERPVPPSAHRRRCLTYTFYFRYCLYCVG
jgi:hypothetical protein